MEKVVASEESCLLERLVETISIGELTTDASTSVIAMLKKLKGEYLHCNISFFISESLAFLKGNNCHTIFQNMKYYCVPLQR